MEELERVTNALHEVQNRKAIFYDDESRFFLPMVHKGVWNLLSKHVSFTNVPGVIAIVLDMLKITVNDNSIWSMMPQIGTTLQCIHVMAERRLLANIFLCPVCQVNCRRVANPGIDLYVSEQDHFLQICTYH